MTAPIHNIQRWSDIGTHACGGQQGVLPDGGFGTLILGGQGGLWANTLLDIVTSNKARIFFIRQR